MSIYLWFIVILILAVGVAMTVVMAAMLLRMATDSLYCKKEKKKRTTLRQQLTELKKEPVRLERFAKERWLLGQIDLSWRRCHGRTNSALFSWEYLTSWNTP